MLWAPPLSSEGIPEPVSLAGVLATGTELAALVLLVERIDLDAGVRPAVRRGWAALVGVGYLALFVFTSNAVGYDASPGRAFQFHTAGDVSLTSPLLYGRAFGHFFYVAPWSTITLVALAAALVATLVGHRPAHCAHGEAEPTTGGRAVLASLVGVSGETVAATRSEKQIESRVLGVQNGRHGAEREERRAESRRVRTTDQPGRCGCQSNTNRPWHGDL